MHLSTQAETLVRRKFACEPIGVLDNIHTRLPSLEIAIGFDRHARAPSTIRSLWFCSAILNFVKNDRGFCVASCRRDRNCCTSPEPRGASPERAASPAAIYFQHD